MLVSAPCQDINVFPVECFVLVGTTVKDAEGLSDAHHMVASKDFHNDSWCCLQAAQMDPASRTGKVEMGLK